MSIMVFDLLDGKMTGTRLTGAKLTGAKLTGCLEGSSASVINI